MKKIIMGLVAILLATPALAQTRLNNYDPGPRLIDGNQLNLMVAAVNAMQGTGTPGAGTFTTLSATGNITLANAHLTSNATTGAHGVVGATTITSASALALAVGRQGATDPVFRVDAATTTVATGLSITGAAAAGGVAVLALSSGTDESLTINAKGAGTLSLNNLTGRGFVAIPKHIVTGSTAPAVTSCGGGSPAITGSDTAGIVTMGTSATGCVITFATAYTAAPYCVVSWIASPLASQSYATSNTAITLTQTSTSSNVVQYVCMGQAGG